MTLKASCTEPAAELAVSVAELKAHTRVDWGTDDLLIEGLIKAAIAHLEGILERAFVSQTWVQKFSEFDDVMPLPIADAIEITSIKYYDGDNVEQTASTALYGFFNDRAGPCVELLDGASWPATYVRRDAVAITYVAGFGNATGVPQDIKQAIMMLAAHWYENREAVVEGSFEQLPFAVQALISRHRILAV